MPALATVNICIRFMRFLRLINGVKTPFIRVAWLFVEFRIDIVSSLVRYRRAVAETLQHCRGQRTKPNKHHIWHVAIKLPTIKREYLTNEDYSYCCKR